MLIDTHCHIDQFPSPEAIVRECEEKAVRVIAVTNLPSHFTVAADRLRGHPLVSAALGIHPLNATAGVRELAAFKRLTPHVNYIGEIGLDFSRHGIRSKGLQERVFDEVLRTLEDRPRFITLHSRGAERTVLEALRNHHIRPGIFHWYTGSEKILDEVIADGHFVSINPAMIISAKGRRVIGRSPRDRILVESDAPFTKTEGRTCTPADIIIVYRALAEQWDVSFAEAQNIVKYNFDLLEKMCA